MRAAWLRLSHAALSGFSRSVNGRAVLSPQNLLFVGTTRSGSWRIQSTSHTWLHWSRRGKCDLVHWPFYARAIHTIVLIKFLESWQGELQMRIAWWIRQTRFGSSTMSFHDLVYVRGLELRQRSMSPSWIAFATGFQISRAMELVFLVVSLMIPRPTTSSWWCNAKVGGAIFFGASQPLNHCKLFSQPLYKCGFPAII